MYKDSKLDARWILLAYSAHEHRFFFFIKVEKLRNNDRDTLEILETQQTSKEREESLFLFSSVSQISTKRFAFLYDFIRFPHHCGGYFCPLFFTIRSVY